MVAEGGSVEVPVLANDSDVEGDALTVTEVTQGANGVVVVNGSGSVTYTHNGSETTADSFTYTVSDGQGGSATAAVLITLTPVNEVPVANDQSIITAEDTAAQIVLTGSDAEGSGLSFTVSSQPLNGTLSGGRRRT